MTAYIVRRTLGMAFVLVLVSALVFTLMSFVPGDPITARYGMDGSSLTSEQEQVLRARYGLNDPIPIQYMKWLRSAVTADLGNSIQQHRPVTGILADRIPVTLQVQGLAFILTLVIAIPCGVVAAIYNGRSVDRMVSALALVGVAMPSFWLGLLLLLAFSVNWEWFPVSGFTYITDDPIEGLRTSALPAVTAAFGGTTAMVLRQVRSAMVDVLRQDYVRTARAKGLAEFVTLTRHALRNALLPTVTVVGLAVGHLLGGSVIIERLFTIPGMGRMVIDAINARDYPIIQGIVLVVAMAVVFTTLVVDLTYAYLDPRIKLR